MAPILEPAFSNPYEKRTTRLKLRWPSSADDATRQAAPPFPHATARGIASVAVVVGGHRRHVWIVVTASPAAGTADDVSGGLLSSRRLAPHEQWQENEAEGSGKDPVVSALAYGAGSRARRRVRRGERGTRSTKGKRSLQEVLRAIYSASMVDKAISVCRADFHNTGQPANVIT